MFLVKVMVVEDLQKQREGPVSMYKKREKKSVMNDINDINDKILDREDKQTSTSSVPYIKSIETKGSRIVLRIM